MILKDPKSELDKNITINLIYLNYAFNRDEGMSHEDLSGVLELEDSLAKEFDSLYKKELLKFKAKT